MHHDGLNFTGWHGLNTAEDRTEWLNDQIDDENLNIYMLVR